MTGHRLDRRRFLVATVALGGVSVVTGCAGDGADGASPGNGPDAEGGLPAGLAAIGSGYLDANESLTEAALVKELPTDVDPVAPSEAQLEQAADAVAADFAAGRVERVNGWWVSQTEARICALGVMRA